jgi:hypothetical protein
MSLLGGVCLAVLLCLITSPAVAQAISSGAGGAAPAKKPAASAARPAAQRGAAEVATAVENIVVTFLADYEYQLGRGIIFQSQGWYPTFTLLHAEQDISVRWEGERAVLVTVTLLYSKRALDSGLLLPEQVGFLLPETEAWFLAVTARRICEVVEKTGRGSPTVTWVVLLPRLDAEGAMVWDQGVTVPITPAEAKEDPKALSERVRGLLPAKSGKK